MKKTINSVPFTKLVPLKYNSTKNSIILTKKKRFSYAFNLLKLIENRCLYLMLWVFIIIQDLLFTNNSLPHQLPKNKHPNEQNKKEKRRNSSKPSVPLDSNQKSCNT